MISDMLRKNGLKRLFIMWVVYPSFFDRIIDLYVSGKIEKRTKQAFDMFLSQEERKDSKRLKHLKEDIRNCYWRYLISPDEYFYYGCENSSDDKRKTFLTDKVMVRKLYEKTGEFAYRHDLRNKYNFYKKTAPYFNREVMSFDDSTTKDVFVEFAVRVRNLFVKVISKARGVGISSHIIETKEQAEELFAKLNSSGAKYIIEEKIQQCKEFVAFNESSCNSVRLPTFLTKKGFFVLQPFFRTGRVGSIVDNAGAGGVFANIDVRTGVICSDGIDERGNYYKAHPDSKITFRGYQIPKWDELLKLAEEIHRTKMPNHVYIGWDFTLTEKGWVLIEGNWGQFVGQYIDKEGIKKQFDNYLQ